MLLRLVFNSLRWVFVLCGLAFFVAGWSYSRLWLAFPLVVGGLVILLIGLLMMYWYSRPNRSDVRDGLNLEVWDVTANKQHNSNSDMIYWDGAFYLVHAISPYHFGTDQCYLTLLRSPDARQWHTLAEFRLPGEDIRDPKLAVICGRLFLYALKNKAFNPEPYTTVFAISDDCGESWEPFSGMEPPGWLFWRPKTRDGETWYMPAYWREHGKSALFRSTDGIHWTQVSEIYQGDRNDETDIEFLPDGRMVATSRLEVSDSIFGNREGTTLIAVSKPPYDHWEPQVKSKITRLDGPNLFAYRDAVYALGRYQPGVGAPFMLQGSAFSRKRTSLFRVDEKGLQYISDLPSAGDTSYGGVAIRGEELFACYYTSDTRKDFPWIVGMVSEAQVKMAKISLPDLERLAKSSNF